MYPCICAFAYLRGFKKKKNPRNKFCIAGIYLLNFVLHYVGTYPAKSEQEVHST